MSTYANVLQNRLNRRHLVVNEPIEMEREERPEYEDSNEMREQALKNKALRARRIADFKKRLKINDTIAALLSMVGLLFAILEYENYYSDDEKGHFETSSYGNILRSFVSLSTMILMIFLFSHSRTCYSIHKEKYSVIYHSTYWESKYFIYFLIEALINIVHVPPGMNFSFTTFHVEQLGNKFVYSLSTIFVTWMLLRCYLVFRLFALYSKWTGSIAESCCGPEGCEANTIFAIKAVLKDKPYETIFLVMLASVVIFGLAIRNFERPMYYQSEGQDGFRDYSYIWNGMWLIAVTMTTVGYGDYYPRTHLGRFVAVLACFWGVFLVSMMVVTLTVSSTFENKEAKAYDILFRLNVKGKMKDKAARAGKLVLQLAAIHKQLNKKSLQPQAHLYKKIDLRNQLTVKLEEFKNSRSLLSDYEVSPEELLRQLTEKIDRDFEEIKEILLSITAIETQLEELEKTQQAVLGALNECMIFSNGMQENLIKFKQNFALELAEDTSAEL